MKAYDNTDPVSRGKTKWKREDVASAIVDFEFRENGPASIRGVANFPRLCGLDAFAAASYGTQRKVSNDMDKIIVSFGESERARLSENMPGKRVAEAAETEEKAKAGRDEHGFDGTGTGRRERFSDTRIPLAPSGPQREGRDSPKRDFRRTRGASLDSRERGRSSFRDMRRPNGGTGESGKGVRRSFPAIKLLRRRTQRATFSEASRRSQAGGKSFEGTDGRSQFSCEKARRHDSGATLFPSRTRQSVRVVG